VARHPPAAELVDSVEAELARGATLTEAAARTGVSRSTVCRWLRDGRVVRRSLRVVDSGDEAELPDDPDEVEAALAQTLLRRALGGDSRACIFLLRSRFRWP
jgi:transcriptional regulator with XRE-family HTH domain